jgi:hypothetical protein
VQVNAANANVEGRAVVEVELRLPNNKFVPLSDINVTHVKSVVTESTVDPSAHELIVRAPTTDYLDSVIRYVQSQGTPRVRYRLGVGVPGRMVYLPWQEQIITSISGVLEGLGSTAGHFVRMSLQDILFTMSRTTKVSSHRGTVSSIVQRIAADNGIVNTVVEPTVGEGLWIQSFMDDREFIQDRLLMRAINQKGRGNYSFYVQDNVLHFHSPDYQAQLKELVYYQTNNIGLTQLDETQNLLPYGAAGVRAVVYDPYSATAAEFVSDPERALRLGNVITPLGGMNLDRNYPFHLSTNTTQEIRNIAQTTYENSRMQLMGLKLDITRSLFLRVGDLVQVIISPSGSKNSPWSGVYYVTNATYNVESGSMVSVFVVRRGEYQTNNLSPTSLTILGDSLVVSPQRAPGQPLNIKLAESSVLAHGSGKSNYTSTFVDTQSPTSAPNPSPKY